MVWCNIYLVRPFLNYRISNLYCRRDFTSQDKARMYLTELKTHPQKEATETKWDQMELGIIRIHVEWVIGLLKLKYIILQSNYTANNLISHHNHVTESTIDEIVWIFVFVSIFVPQLCHKSNNYDLRLLNSLYCIII